MAAFDGGRVAAVLAGLTGLVLLGVLASTVGRPVRDDMVLDGIVEVVALDWRDFGEDQAQQRLKYELDHLRVDARVGDADCSLRMSPEGEREVVCAWDVPLFVPWRAEPLRVPFGSYARIDRQGSLHRASAW
jgi:hypothetical protein